MFTIVNSTDTMSRGVRISYEKKQDYTHHGEEFIFHEYNL